MHAYSKCFCSGSYNFFYGNLLPHVIVSLVLNSCQMKVGRIKGFYLINSTVSRSKVYKNGIRH